MEGKVADLFFHPIAWPFACLVALVCILIALDLLEEHGRKSDA